MAATTEADQPSISPAPTTRDYFFVLTLQLGNHDQVSLHGTMTADEHTTRWDCTSGPLTRSRTGTASRSGSRS